VLKLPNNNGGMGDPKPSR